MARAPKPRKKPRKGMPKEIGPAPSATPVKSRAPKTPRRRMWRRLTGLRTLFGGIKKKPLLAAPIVIGFMCAAWVVYNADRSWVPVNALISSRDVYLVSESDEDGRTYEYYYAAFDYVYDMGDTQYVAGFEDNTVGENGRVTRDFAEAVVEAKRFEVADEVPMFVDSRHPEVSTKTKPARFLPLFWLGLCTLSLYIWIETSFGLMLLQAAFLCYGTWSLTKIPTAAELDQAYHLRSFVEMVRDYPSLGYVPQNKLGTKYNLLEELLKEWGRPDRVILEDGDKTRTLTLTYRHGKDWSEAWSVDLMVSGDEPPVPIEPAREDHPTR